jgi:DNA modification methylase
MSQTFLDGRVTLYGGDSREVLKTLPEASVDSVVCDPPYGLEFMGKEWDKFAPERTKYHGERADTRKNIGDDDTKPSSRHHVSYSMGRANFKRCQGCGKREFSGSPCKCDNPSWILEQPEGPPPRMVAFQKFMQEIFAEVLRVLKPGGHLVAFSGTRTYHRLACAIEDAGFEIRDQLAWAYGSGFPKSLDVSKALDKAAGAEREVVGPRTRVDGKKPGHSALGANAVFGASADLGDLTITAPATDAARHWSGWGTALKPAWEPIVLARKPLIGTVAANVLEHGTGALNIDGCRVGVDASDANHRAPSVAFDGATGIGYSGGLGGRPNENLSSLGRWPANLLHDGSEEVVRLFPETTSGALSPDMNIKASTGWSGGSQADRVKSTFDANSGSAARFFYTSKADADDRLGSKHPTVKPVDLMQWLVRLVTPRGGVCLDPFAGTGTTGEAAWREGCRAILIEREEEYQADIARRLDLAVQPTKRAAVAKTKNQLDDPSDLPLFALEGAA